MATRAQEKKVLELIDQSQKDNIAFLQKIVQIPSLTGDEAQMGEFLIGEMPKFGVADTKIVQQMVGRPNVWGRLHGKTGKPSITLYAHYDTVPVGDITQWKYGPFSASIVGNNIYGRGVNDHKFPIPALLFATKAIRDAGITLKGDIVYTFVCDEEFGGHRGMRYLVDEGLCDTSYLLYASGGGDGKSIGLAANARAYYRITVKGKTAHTGNNEKGINAAVKAARLIVRLEKLGQEINNRRQSFKTGDVEIQGKGRFSINLVHAYTTGNNVPDRCTIQIDRRLIPKIETFEQGQGEIQRVVNEMKKQDKEFDAEVAWNPEGWMNFAVSIPDKKLIEALQRSVKRVLGFTPAVGSGETSGSSDHGWFNLKYPDRPFVSYGAGGGGNGHTYDEWATTDGLINTTKIYALFLMDLLGTD